MRFHDLKREAVSRLFEKGLSVSEVQLFCGNSLSSLSVYTEHKITGSVGLQGMTDAMWLVDRGDVSPNASITGRGRDILDFEYAVKCGEVVRAS